jgi:hypothetical protein
MIYDLSNNKSLESYSLNSLSNKFPEFTNLKIWNDHINNFTN